jgi:hypothetical protein
VARLAGVTLKVDARIREGRPPSVAAAAQRTLEAALVRNHLHADTAATADSLDHDRVANSCGSTFDGLDRLGRIAGNGRIGSRHWADTRCKGNVTRLHLVTERVENLGRRPDEDRTGVGHRACKPGLFAQKAVAGVNRSRAGLLENVNDLVDVQVRVSWRRRPNEKRFVSFLDMWRVLVRLRVDGDGRDAEPSARTNDPTRNLAAVCDQHLRKEDGHDDVLARKGAAVNHGQGISRPQQPQFSAG